MKYSKPSLRSFNSESEMYCGVGSGASGDGCTVGGMVLDQCSFGSNNLDGCVDGGEAASGCTTGTADENFSGSRCYVGNSPDDR